MGGSGGGVGMGVGIMSGGLNDTCRENMRYRESENVSFAALAG